jgi:hypothetical protein
MEASQSHKIELYLSDRLEAGEREQFEAQLEADPQLRAEVSFQSDVIRGLQAYRKTELKARLNAIDVSTTPWWQSALPGTAVKWIAGVALMGTAGFILWPFAETTPEEMATAITIDTPQQESIVVWNMPLETQTESKPSDGKGLMKADSEEVAEIQNQSEERNTESRADFDPEVYVPEAGEGSSEEAFRPQELERPENTEEEALEEQAPIDVEWVDDRTRKLSYRYYSGKLYLYGDFGDHPYEILEINASTGRNIFLYHKQTYYTIRVSDRMQGLEPITDQDLMKELAILRTTD